MIEIKNITKTFNPGTVNEHKAIDNLNLVLNEGDFITVIGSNGAGKSTTLNSIAGLTKSSGVKGSIKYKGTRIKSLPHRLAP